jgi:hypothetical protein
VNFWLLWDANNQQLWDKMVGTIVVKDPHNMPKPNSRDDSGTES